MNSELTVRYAILAYQKKREEVEVLISLTKGVRKHVLNTLYDRYGAKELSCQGLSKEDVEDELIIAVLEATRLYKTDGKLTDMEEKKKYISYVHITIDGHMKRYIEVNNGISHHYAACLLRIKKFGLDLFESDDEDLYKAIADFGLKNPKKSLKKLRDIFSYSAECENFDDIPEQMAMDMNYSNIEVEEVIARIKRKVSASDWKIFVEYHFSSRKPTIKLLSLENDTTPYRINIAIKNVMYWFEQEYKPGYDVLVEKTPQSFAKISAGNHNPKDIETIELY